MDLEKEIQKVLEIMQGIVKEAQLPREVSGVIYRADYQDIQVILDDDFHCEIRVKLFQDYLLHKHPDARREIIYLIQHAAAFEEWERPPSGAGSGDGGGKISIDDSDQYDF